MQMWKTKEALMLSFHLERDIFEPLIFVRSRRQFYNSNVVLKTYNYSKTALLDLLWLLPQDVVILPPRFEFIVEIYVFIFLTKPWIFTPHFYLLISMFWPHFCIIKQINLWTVVLKFTVFFSFIYFLEL